ncbi:MAG: thiamine-phosphate kinase, partial [Arenicella sp.]|nr:thiamine-phosphate kinase [Arenicella sp.]
MANPANSVLDEFSLIQTYCREIGVQHADTLLGVGDDAAIVRVPNDMQLAVSVDAMVEGTHFEHNTAPEKLAAKLMAVNLSDMAAMGAVPKWATIALSLPEPGQAWMEAFSQSLHNVASQYRVELIGGDTTRGPLSMSMQILGLLPLGKGLSRTGAKAGDDVYVSGILGDAALALCCLRNADLAAQLDVER